MALENPPFSSMIFPATKLHLDGIFQLAMFGNLG